MKERVWTSLVTSLQNGQCVLVLGPDIPACPCEGAAYAGGMKSVRDTFCGQLAKELEAEEQKVGEPTLYAIAQQYEDFTRLHPKNIAANYFRNPGCKPGTIHEKLARSPFSLILTTCHDGLFAKALLDQNKQASRYWYHYRGEQRDNRELDQVPTLECPTIYHLFGAYDDPHSLVLTENDLLDFVIHLISGRPKLPDSLRKELRSRTFLFVGFGIRHWYIRVLLKLVMRNLELSAGSVVLESLGTLAEPEREQTVLFYKRGSRVEVVDLEIDHFLDELWNRFQDAGGYLGKDDRRLRRAQVFISYEKSDTADAEKVYESLPKDQFDTWLDTHLLEAGEDWNAKLEQTIKSSDYFLVLNSENLVKKQVGYVNKEIELALDQQKYHQPGSRFIIPLQMNSLSAEQGRQDLKRFQQLPLRREALTEDIASIVKTLTRDFQRRMNRSPASDAVNYDA